MYKKLNKKKSTTWKFQTVGKIAFINIKKILNNFNFIFNINKKSYTAKVVKKTKKQKFTLALFIKSFTTPFLLIGE